MNKKSQLSLDRTGEKALYRQIEESLENYIRQEKLDEGSRIPSLSVLADKFSTNELTVRRAIRGLVARGLLISRQGRGTFVSRDAHLRKVLWVCGVDIFDGDISPYFLYLLKKCRAECAELGLKLVPAWLKNYGDEVEEYCTEDTLRNYAGYIFAGCCVSHPLLKYVQDRHLKYVLIFQGQEIRPRCVTVNYPEAIRLGIQHLVKKGHSHITLVALSNLTQIIKNSLEETDVPVDYIELPAMARMSQHESNGYHMMQELLSLGRANRGMLILDDIISKGITRAILASDTVSSDDFDLVVMAATQMSAPVGMPLTYLVHDVDWEAREAIRILSNQLEGKFGITDYSIADVRLNDFQDTDLKESDNSTKTNFFITQFSMTS